MLPLCFCGRLEEAPAGSRGGLCGHRNGDAIRAVEDDVAILGARDAWFVVGLQRR